MITQKFSFLKKPKTIFGFLLLLAAIFFNVHSIFLHLNNDFFSATAVSSLATETWFLSIVFLIISIFVLSQKTQLIKKVEELSHKEKVLFISLLLVGFLFRLYKLNHQGVYLDEWYWITEARKILAGTITTPFGFIGDQPSNMPAYPVALLLALLGDNYLAVRLTGIFYSIGNMIFIFYFLKTAFNKKTAFISLLFLATSIWDIHMAQLGWNNVNLNPFLISGTLFFLYRGLINFSYRDILLTGLFLGISLNLLYIAALTSISVIVYFAYCLLTQKAKFRILSLFLTLLIAVFLTSSQTFIKIHRFPQQSIERHKNFVKENFKYSQKNNGISYYLKQVKLSFNDFFYSKENYKTIGLWKITLEPAIVLFFLIGLAYTLGSLSKYRSLVILLFFVIMFIPVVVLYRFTSVWREYGFLPTIYIIAGLGIDKITKFIPKKISLVILLLIYFSSFAYVFRNYYYFQLDKEPDSYETGCKKTAQYIKNSFPEDRLILLPKELCNELISIVLDKKRYNFLAYDSYEELSAIFTTAKKFIIVRITTNEGSSQFTKDNPPDIFFYRLKKNFPNIISIPIIDKENYKLYSILYTL